MTRSSPEPRAGRRGLFPRRRAATGPRATLRQLLPYLLENKPLMAGIALISIIGAAFSLAQPLLVSFLIAEVQQGRMLSWLVWLLVGIVAAGSLIQGLQHFLLQRAGESIVLSTRRKLVAKLLRLPIVEFDARRTGDLVSRVGSDTIQLRAVLTQGLVEAIGGALTFAGAVIAMIVLDIVLFAVTCGIVVLAVICVLLLGPPMQAASAAAQAKVGELTSSIERAVSNIRVIRAAGATEREQELIERDALGAYRRGLDVARISALVVPVSGFALQGAIIAVLGVGGLRVATGELTIANLIAFIMFMFMMITPITLFFGAVMAVSTALGSLGRIQEIIDLPAEGASDREGVTRTQLRGPAHAHAAPGEPAIELREVSFRYPADVVRARAARERAIARLDRLPSGHRSRGLGASGESETAQLFAPEGPDDNPEEQESPLVLDGVSFRVPRGGRLALVGPSGAGKSTILALIERFYDPDAGSIHLGGVDIRGIDRAELRGQIGYVQQNAPVLAGTLRDNLLLAKPGADDDECAAVLRAVNLGHVLDRSRDGLDAPVGESGVRLSGGEGQRLAIARILLSAPPVLLLDESTSALDGANEHAMRQAIDRVAQDRSLIIVAHRLATVVDADRIVVLDRGRVLGTGTHAELLESTPLYRELAQHQLLAPPA